MTDKIILIPTIQCKDKKDLHHSLENKQCPYCQIKVLMSQLKMEVDTDHNALQERLNKAYEKGLKDGQSGKTSR